MAPPLTGVRVVEVTSWMAAPSAGAILADMGADVIKVEPPRGDPVRGLMRPPRISEGSAKIDYSFQVDNRGKRSVAISVDQPEGSALVRRLTAGAQVFLSNLLPSRQLQFGLDADTLLRGNPRLVHATLTGYGINGPDADRPGYDTTAFFGRGAITDSMTEPAGTPPQPRTAQGDHTTGLALVIAILGGLRMAEQSGEGQVVDASLLAAAAWTMATELSAPLIDGREPRKRDRRHLITPLGNQYRCRDDRWIVLCMPSHWWPRLCEALGRTDWLSDPRFKTVKDRFDNMPSLIDAIDAEFAQRPLAEWARILDAAGLIWEPAATLVELTNDPQAQAVGLFPEIRHRHGTFRTVAAPFAMRGTDIVPRGPAPDLGEHTAEILLGAGLSRAEVSALAAAGIVAPIANVDTP